MPAKSAQSKSPPRARLAFRVGIVGHRPDRLPRDAATLEALSRTLRNVLEVVQTEVTNFAKADRADPSPVYAPDSPILRAISPLAEGSDRMFAAAAIELGFELLCPMPFHQQEFEKDFLPPHALEVNSRDKFHELLKRARQSAGLVTFELDGRRSAAGAAYGMAGRVVLNQADFLIAVWDRAAAAGSGGTVQTLREAVYFHLPVLWMIHSSRTSGGYCEPSRMSPASKTTPVPTGRSLEQRSSVNRSPRKSMLLCKPDWHRRSRVPMILRPQG